MVNDSNHHVVAIQSTLEPAAARSKRPGEIATQELTAAQKATDDNPEVAMNQQGSSSTPTLDRGKLHKLRGHFDEDPGFVSEVLETYLADSKNVVPMLREVVEAADTRALRNVAHMLKGSSSNVGARRMVELCRTLEELGEAGEIEGAMDLLVKVEEEFERVVVEIRNELQPGAS